MSENISDHLCCLFRYEKSIRDNREESFQKQHEDRLREQQVMIGRVQTEQDLVLEKILSGQREVVDTIMKRLDNIETRQDTLEKALQAGLSDRC